MSDSQANRKLFLKKIIAASCSFLFTLVMLEIVVRVRDSVKASEEEKVWNGEKGFLNVRSKNPRLVYEYNPNAKTDLFGTEVAINEHGYRDRSYSETKPDHVIRIAIVGDSIAFGFRVNENEIYSKVLEKDLNRSFPGRFEVLNMGVAGYNTLQEIELLKTRGLRFDPDIIVLNYSLNDRELYADGGLTGYLMKTATFSHLFGLLRYKWIKFLDKNTKIGMQQVVTGLDELKRISDAKKIPVAVIVHPIFLDNWPKGKHEEIGWLGDLSKQRNFYFLDLSAAFAGKEFKSISIDAMHPNVLGHQITAAALKNLLQKESLIPSEATSRSN